MKCDAIRNLCLFDNLIASHLCSSHMVHIKEISDATFELTVQFDNAHPPI